MIPVSVDVILIDVIQNHRNFAPNFFNFKIILAPNVLENYVTIRVVNFTLIWDIPQRVPDGEIRRHYTKEVEAPDIFWSDAVTSILPYSNYSTILQNGNLWDCASNVSQWVHMDDIICVPPEINNHFVITLTTPEGYLPIIFYPSINGSTCLVSMNEKFVWKCSTYFDLFRLYCYSQKHDIFHPSAVGVCQLIHCHLLSVIFTNQSGQ